MSTQESPPGWTDDGTKLHRTFVFASFPDAMAFMLAIAFFCHKRDHHPEWTNVYNRVVVALTTHDAGGVTAKDVALALHMNARFDPPPA